MQSGCGGEYLLPPVNGEYICDRSLPLFFMFNVIRSGESGRLEPERDIGEWSSIRFK